MLYLIRTAVGSSVSNIHAKAANTLLTGHDEYDKLRFDALIHFWNVLSLVFSLVIFISSTIIVR
jgi:hypothetical protein